jgi:hypothetical protein
MQVLCDMLLTIAVDRDRSFRESNDSFDLSQQGFLLLSRTFQKKFASEARNQNCKAWQALKRYFLIILKLIWYFIIWFAIAAIPFMILYYMIMFTSTTINRISDSDFCDYVGCDLYWNESVIHEVPYKFDRCIYFTVDCKQFLIYLI